MYRCCPVILFTQHDCDFTLTGCSMFTSLQMYCTTNTCSPHTDGCVLIGKTVNLTGFVSLRTCFRMKWRCSSPMRAIHMRRCTRTQVPSLRLDNLSFPQHTHTHTHANRVVFFSSIKNESIVTAIASNHRC